jgi:hypothetical protein
VDSLARRARVAEADATAAKQAAHAAAEELEGSPNGGDAVRDLKAYFESEGTYWAFPESRRLFAHTILALSFIYRKSSGA